MIRKSEYYEKIDMYLNGELSENELRDFNVELLINSKLADEVKFYREVQNAAQEQDIMDLRENLSNIMDQEEINFDEIQESVVAENINYNFGLSNELESFREFHKPVESRDFNNLPHSLPRIHLFQHEVAAKENIHHFYKDQIQKSENEDDLMSSADEIIFEEVQNALQEKDVFELRANLQQIAKGMPEHERTTEEIEKFIADDLSQDLMLKIKSELNYSNKLERDINLHKEIDKAIAESDIMNLRNKLNEIQESEFSTSKRVEEIDKYINFELEEEELASFENELITNPDMASELQMYKDIEVAARETDIINLRDKLQSIDKKEVKDKQRSIRIPLSRMKIASIAASVVILLGIAGLISKQTTTEGSIYNKYYQTYQTSGIVRSGNSTMDNTLTIALQKFNAQEFDTALELFRKVIEFDQKNPVGHFYSGVSYQETGRFNQAIEEYQIVVKDKDNLFIEQAEWYIGLCYLQTQERKKAYRQLERIAKSKSYYSNKAEAIIRKLKFIE